MTYATIYTKTGLIGAEITTYVNKAGIEIYSYIGKFGAGSGYTKQAMQDIIVDLLSTKKGSKVVFA